MHFLYYDMICYTLGRLTGSSTGPWTKLSSIFLKQLSRFLRVLPDLHMTMRIDVVSATSLPGIQTWKTGYPSLEQEAGWLPWHQHQIPYLVRYDK